MFTIFNSESLWIGRDMKRAYQIRETLGAAGILYKVKARSHQSRRGSRGSQRAMSGSFGISSEHMYEYEIFVYKKDLERAKYLVSQIRPQD